MFEVQGDDWCSKEVEGLSYCLVMEGGRILEWF